MVEERGHRLLKFDTAGNHLQTVGHVGLPWHHDDYLAWPTDAAVDSSGHVWVVMNPAVKEFDASGAVVRVFPASDPWNIGTDNSHFNGPAGIAFDGAGRLYVSDGDNHRILVYTFSGSGDLVYSTTIGVTGVSGTDNAHLNLPQHIAVYGNRLYIADALNHRGQIYDIGGSAPVYSATIGVSGVPGNDNAHLSWPSGVAVNAGHIYIAESDNHRVQVFNRTTLGYVATLGTGWGVGNAQFKNPRDVALDSAGNIYVADMSNARVQKFSSGLVYQRTYGVTGVPYAADDIRLNGPWGVAVAADGSIYTTESKGARLVKLSAAGVQKWSVGEAGVWGDDNTHFGDWFWSNPAIDARGRIYVADSSNHRIQIFNPNGAYLATFGNYGTGQYQLYWPTSVAISSINGDIFVADNNNQRIQVYNSSWIYKATLGVVDEPGTDNQHFHQPFGVAVDRNGAIYVADSDNYRVQKCTLNGASYTYTNFVGETGVFDGDFGHLRPLSVAVDSAGRVLCSR